MALFRRFSPLLKLGIRARLIALMAIAAGAMALDSYLEIVSRRDQRLAEVEERMVVAVKNAAENQYEFASAARLLLGVLTNLAPSIDACGDGFRELAAGSKWLKALAIAAPDGRLVCSSGPLDPNVSVADRAYFTEVMHTHGFVLSDYLTGRVFKAPVMIAAAPRMKGDTVDSVVILTIDLAWLDHVAENVGGGEDVSVVLLDTAGTVVSADGRSHTLVGTNLSQSPLMRKLAAEPGRMVPGTGPDGVARLYAAAQLPGTGAQLVLGYPEAQLLAPVHRTMQEEMLKNGLFFLALLGISWALAEQVIVRPIRTLTRAASAFGSGDRHSRVSPESVPGDFTELAETFNTTAELLARNEEAIVEKNRRLAEVNSRLLDLARRDELTGLANRRVLNERLHQVFQKPERDVALLVLDLDKFKPVNDVMGHPVGDRVLQEAARRLLARAREGDLVARLGGDEFAMVLVCDGEGCDRPRRMAEAVTQSMAIPFSTGNGGHVEIGATVGIAVARRDASDSDELLRAADLAMYRAKREDRGGFRFFEKAMQNDLENRMTLEAELRAGIRTGEIVPYYQPFVDLSTGRIVGVEVLARWEHPSRGVLPPAMFIGIASDVGLSEALTRNVLGAACRDAQAWAEDIALSVNLSPSQLNDPLLPTLLASLARDHGLSPRRIEVEITEDALIHDFAAARAVMQSFRSLGMRIALDDFGTGYSSLQHLHELRFDKIKIDRSFVMDILASEDRRMLVSAILALARNLNLSVTAEGIEDLATADLLREMGCTYGQGYAFGRPVPRPDMDAMLSVDVGSGRAEVA